MRWSGGTRVTYSVEDGFCSSLTFLQSGVDCESHIRSALAIVAEAANLTAERVDGHGLLHFATFASTEALGRATLLYDGDRILNATVTIDRTNFFSAGSRTVCPWMWPAIVAMMLLGGANVLWICLRHFVARPARAIVDAVYLTYVAAVVVAVCASAHCSLESYGGVVLHEVGHAFGLPHSENFRCGASAAPSVMAASTSNVECIDPAMLAELRDMYEHVCLPGAQPASRMCVPRGPIWEFRIIAGTIATELAFVGVALCIRRLHDKVFQVHPSGQEEARI